MVEMLLKLNYIQRALSNGSEENGLV